VAHTIAVITMVVIIVVLSECHRHAMAIREQRGGDGACSGDGRLLRDPRRGRHLSMASVVADDGGG
jgi:hypothetical protein